MECTALEAEESIEMQVSSIWKMTLSLLGGALIGVGCTLFVYVYKKFHNSGIWDCCCCGPCCSCTAASTSDVERKSSLSSIESWVMVPENIESDQIAHTWATTPGLQKNIATPTPSDSGMTDGTEEASLLGSDTESVTQIREDEDEAHPLENSTNVSFAEVLAQQSRETAAELLFNMESNATLRLESSFIQQKSDTFLFMIDEVATILVRANIADVKWKKKLVAYCKRVFIQTKKREQTNAIISLTSKSTHSPETLAESKLCQITRQLLEYLRATLDEDTRADKTEAGQIVNEFQSNWVHFEKLQAQLHLNTIKETEKLLREREEIAGIIEQNSVEIMDEIRKHLKRHAKGIQQLMLDDVVTAMTSGAGEDIGLVKKVEKKWGKVLEKYEREVQTRKGEILKDTEQHIQKERLQCMDRCDQRIQALKTEAHSGDISTRDYITAYCTTLETKAKDNAQMDKMETQLAATEISLLTEDVGITYLKQGVREEEKLYSRLLKKTSWTETTLQEINIQHKSNLSALQANIRAVKKAHRSNLQERIQRMMQGEGSLPSQFISEEIQSHQESIRNVIGNQADLSEIECQTLLNECTTLLQTVQVQLELRRLKQERKLKRDYERQEAVVERDLKLVNNDDSQWDCSITAMVKLQKDKEALQQQYDESIQDMKQKLQMAIRYARQDQQLLFQQQIEKIRRGHERKPAIRRQGTATNIFQKSKFLDKSSGATKNVMGERVLHQHQIINKVIEDKIEKRKSRQELVLQQKLQAKRLERPFSSNTETSKRIVANVLVGLLAEVRYNRVNKELEEELSCERLRIIQRMKRRCQVQSKLEMRQRETEMTVKLASVLNTTRAQLERDLRKQSDRH